MPIFVSYRKPAPEAADAGVHEPVPPPSIELVPRNCRLQQYQKAPVPSFKVSGQIIAYASPDSTFAVTKTLIDSAKKSIVIGIYDFTAGYVRDLLKHAMGRGVKVTLMLDTDHVKGEDEIFTDLATFGASCVPAPSCASSKIHFFRSSHEKIIVIDDEWSMIQSGNFSENSIPMNVKDGGDPTHFKTGNRDMGLAVQSKAMAQYFGRLIQSDIKLELDAPESLGAAAPPPQSAWVEAAPKKLPSKLFPSKTFTINQPLSIQPILSPDNYLDAIPKALEAATTSVLIEQQYIKSMDAPVEKLLDALKKARSKNKTLDVRIVLGKIFSAKDIPKEKANLAKLSSDYGLKLGTNIRYIDTSRLVHCHNKMVIVDGTTVLVSSQNWSKAAVAENREAGLLLTHKGIASYFTGIFETDWATGQKALPASFAPESIGIESLRRGGFVEVSPGDFVVL